MLGAVASPRRSALGSGESGPALSTEPRREQQAFHNVCRASRVVRLGIVVCTCCLMHGRLRVGVVYGL